MNSLRPKISCDKHKKEREQTGRNDEQKKKECTVNIFILWSSRPMEDDGRYASFFVACSLHLLKIFLDN